MDKAFCRLVWVVLAAMVQPAMGSGLDRYDAFLVVYKDVDPNEMAAQDQGRMELIDVKHRLLAGREGLIWLEPLSGGNRYRVLPPAAGTRAAQASVNTDLQFTLEYLDGRYQVQMEQMSNGRHAVFRLYPLERRGLRFFREQRVGKWEARGDSAEAGQQGVGSCTTGYRREGDSVLLLQQTHTGELLRYDALSAQGDQLVLTPTRGVDKTPLRRLEYALAEAPATRFSIQLEAGDLADYGSADLTGGLTLVQECQEGQLLGATPSATESGKQDAMPGFSDYPAEVSASRLEEVDLDSHAQAERFRSRLRALEGKSPDFAGHYLVQMWGCGSGCQQFAIVDSRTGEVFMEDDWSAGLGLCYRPDSSLLIVNPGASAPGFMESSHYRWDGASLVLLWQGQLAEGLPSPDYGCASPQ